MTDYEPFIMEHMAQTGGLVCARMSDVEAESVEWLWPGRIAIGKLTLLVGDPGLGKSFLSLDIAARVSAGMSWPDDPYAGFGEPGGVVLLNAEDGLADTIRPRLNAARANAENIVALQGARLATPKGERQRPINLEHDVSLIENALILHERPRLVIIDPITAYLGSTDSHNNAEVRAVLANLSQMAARRRVAVLGVSHLNKGGQGVAPIYRTMGSLAFTAAARGVLGVTRDKADPDRRILAPIKSNLAVDNLAMAYRVRTTRGEAVPPGTLHVPRTVWEQGTFRATAEEVFGGDQQASASLREACEWLRSTLAAGPRSANDVKEKAKADGIELRTLYGAKSRLEIVSQRSGFGPGGAWEWALPQSHGDGSTEGDPHTQRRPTYGSEANLCDSEKSHEGENLWSGDRKNRSAIS